MPPFTTLNGQTGYFDNNGQFIPATQDQYNQQFGMLQQFGGNPFLNAAQQSPLNNQRTNFVQQGTIQSPLTAAQTNEQKVMQAQGDDVPMIGNMPYQMTAQGPGIQKGKSFFGFDAMTASGHPLNTQTNTVYNVYDLMSQRKNKVVNPLVAEMRLAESNQAQNLFNALQNPTAPTQTQVTAPITQAPEITPTPTTEQSGGGNWLSNMFNSKAPEAPTTATNNVVDNGLKSDVLGTGKLGFSGKEFFGSDAGKATSAITGAGVGLASTLIKTAAPDKYDPRVGMSKPNLGGNLFGDATFTQVGLNPALMAATGGISALVGGGVDLIKNAVKYAKQKDRYENKKLATDTMQSIDDARENMKPDYTGYARFGTQVKNPYLTARSGIYIKPENRGKFTKWADDRGMGVQEAADKVMANKDKYSTSVVKMANFANNAAKWGRFGMETDPVKKKLTKQ